MTATSEYWKVVKGECTLPDAMKLLGIEQNQIDRAMEISKNFDQHDAGTFHTLAMAMTSIAYDALVEAKEIDPEKIFNFAERKYSENPRQFDIGRAGKKTYTYRNGEWMSF